MNELPRGYLHASRKFVPDVLIGAEGMGALGCFYVVVRPGDFGTHDARLRLASAGMIRSARRCIFGWRRGLGRCGI